MSVSGGGGRPGRGPGHRGPAGPGGVGRADDLLTATLLRLAARCFRPAMHTEMWQHPATVVNVATLRSRGAVVLETRVQATHRDRYRGRTASEPEEISTFAELLLARGDALPHDLSGVKVLVTAGDSARRWTRCGSSATGVRASRATRWRGWRLSAGRRSPDSRKHRRVGRPGRGVRRAGDLSGADARGGVKHAPDAHVLVMAAAVADSVPPTSPPARSKKSADPPIGRRWSWCAPRTCWPARSACVPTASFPICGRSSGSPPRPAMQTVTSCTMRGPSCAARAATCWWSTPWGRPGFRGGQQRGLAARRRRQRGRPGAWFEDSDGKPYCGRDRDVPARLPGMNVARAGHTGRQGTTFVCPIPGNRRV